MHAQPVLHLALAQIMQVRLPVTVFGKIVSHVPGQENVPRIAAIHYPLGDIDSGSGDIGFVVHIPDPIHRPAVHAHAQPDHRMTSQCSADLQRTSRRFFRTVKESKRHPVPGGHSDELAACFRRTETLGISNDLIELLE